MDNYKTIAYFIFLNEKFIICSILFLLSFWANWDKEIFRFISIVILIYIIVLFLVFISTPFDLYWQLDSTAARVVRTLSFSLAFFGLYNLNEKIKGLKIGIPKEYRVENMPKEIDNLWKKGIDILKKSGAKIVDVSLPHTKYALPTYYIVAPAEASSNLARYDGVKYGHRSKKGKNLIEMYENTRGEGFGDEVKRRILIGTYVLSSGYYDAYYLKAQKIRRLIKNDFDKCFKNVDAILTPSTPSSAFQIGEKTNDPISMYLNDIFTVPVNLAGIPAISIPAGQDEKGYPLGLQLITKALDEQKILNIAFAMEKSINFKQSLNRWWE